MVRAFRQTQQIMDGGTAFAAAPVNGATGAPAAYYITPDDASGAILQFDIQDGTTFSLTFSVYAYNPYADSPEETTLMLASAARTANDGFEMQIYPGVSETSNVSKSRLMPKFWKLVISGTTDTCKIKAVVEYIP